MVSKKFFVAILVCVALGGGALLWLHGKKSDRRQIMEQLHALEALISIGPKETRAPFLTKVQKVRKLTGNPCQLSLDEGRLSGAYPPQEIATLIERFQAQVVYASLSFLDVKITFAQKKAATIDCSANLKGLTRDRERLDEFRELKISLQNIKGHWKFTGFRTVEAMEK